MKIAVTGPNGQLGRELVKQGAIPLRGWLLSEEITANIEAVKPDAIINCAALTDVDYCEESVLLTAATNTDGVRYLSRCFPGYLIQISTDYVFDGLQGPYGVRDVTNPINIYGWSKLGAELIMRRHRGPSLIIRTTILFSNTTNNFVAKIVKQMRQGTTINLYNPEMTGTPTYVPMLAAEILRMVQAGYAGCSHVAGWPTVTRLEFARQIADTFGFDPRWIVPDYTLLADATPRPLKAGLVCDCGEYQIVNGHNWLDGLLELSKQKGIYI